MALDARYLDEEAAARYDLTPGWWAFDLAGPILGPYASQDELSLRAELSTIAPVELRED